MLYLTPLFLFQALLYLYMSVSHIFPIMVVHMTVFHSMLFDRLSCLISENCATSMETSVGRSTAVYKCTHPPSASIPSTINLPFYVCVMYSSCQS